jgi:hypothetical protein
MDGMEGVDREAGVLLRFRQVWCPDICVFYPLPVPWFAATSSLQNMGSNARAGFLDLMKNLDEEDSVQRSEALSSVAVGNFSAMDGGGSPEASRRGCRCLR